ncbi:MAG: hypothetical protein AAFV93_02600 [Chloroflexota bacterium]
MNTTTITQNGKVVANCETFLTTFYQNVPDNLWLEIRCIHPITKNVRSLWIAPNDITQRNNILKHANQLNREGYGIYFAPCLRNEQIGKTEHATLATALWIDIDCDDDLPRRDRALAKLEAFEPAPSIIVDSGGGWHGYWLLDEPYKLENDEDKKHIKLILEGLFSALDGDEGYVKSVASVMRLPDSTNTKPERGGVICTVKQFEPDRRYSLSDFDWLKVELPTRKSNLNIQIDGLHPLSPRTQDYLVAGSSDGSRNNDLFAAACQLRDAGYSQSEAENQLVSRYVADGSAGEHTASREKEARKTIASAYSQPAREPIAVTAREVIQQLVSPYRVEQHTERPTNEQIVAAVDACLGLNAVEWAEQRQQLKAICGDGLKISDIDRLYNQRKKVQERQYRQEFVDTESYRLIDGKMIYRNETYKGVIEKTVTDWVATALQQKCQVDDDGKEIHVTTIELQRGLSSKTLDVPGDIFVDDLALRRFIGSNAGSQYVVRAGMGKHLVPAIVNLSGEYPTHRHYNFMGWREIDGRWVYITPQDCITAKGKLSEPPSVELDNRLRDYGVQALDIQESLDAFAAVTKVLPEQHAPALIAFALLPLLQRFFPDAVTRPAIQLLGTSGSGKSEIAALLSSFYGNFNRDTPPAQWGDTINSVEALGYPLADAIYWVDDYKEIYADTRTFTRFLQSYSRKMGRGRLTREAKMRIDKPCRGMILSTGETMLEREMSVTSRMLILEIPPWRKRDPEGLALAEANKKRDKLTGFTAHFASWIAKQLEDDNFEADLADRFASNLRGFNKKLMAELGSDYDTGRVTPNWAVLISVYQLLRRFMTELDADDLLPIWQDTAIESARGLREERASEVFLDLLGQLIAGGQAVIDDNMRQPNEYPASVTVVGYSDESFIYLLPEIALREVNKVQPLRFSATAIGMQLKEDGLLLAGNTSLTIQKRVNGARVRVWQLTAQSLGCDDCDD